MWKTLKHKQGMKLKIYKLLSVIPYIYLSKEGATINTSCVGYID